VTVAAEVGAAAIITPTLSGTTPRIISRFRGPYPIIAATPSREVERRLALSWGVFPSGCEEFTDTDQMLTEGERAALRTGLVHSGELAVFVTVAMPKGKSGATNLVKVKRVE